MGDIFDYSSLLERALRYAPKQKVHGERFEIPTAKVITIGNRTIIQNFSEICDILRR